VGSLMKDAEADEVVAAVQRAYATRHPRGAGADA
jgi:hypothetical protein